MRTKQINVSIPEESIPLLAAFDAVCKRRGKSRSETIIGLMRRIVSGSDKVAARGDTENTRQRQAVDKAKFAEAAKDEPLPSFLS